MNLYIYTQNGTPINHPLTESNLLMVHPEIDFNNLPENICKFIRVPKPELNVFELFDTPEFTYEIVDNICYDVWHIRDMSEEEKENKINSIESTKPYPSWTFDRQTLEFIPPTPQPDQGFWNWDEESLSWVEFVPPEE